MFFLFYFFCLSQNWVLEFMAVSADTGFVQGDGERNNVVSFGDFLYFEGATVASFHRGWVCFLS